MPTIVPANAEGLPAINRRRLLGGIALASAATAGATAAVAATYEPAEPAKTPREQAIWHMRELERLAKEDGAKEAVVMLVGRFWEPAFDCKPFMIEKNGTFTDFDLQEGRPAMFAPKGGAA